MHFACQGAFRGFWTFGEIVACQCLANVLVSMVFVARQGASGVLEIFLPGLSGPGFRPGASQTWGGILCDALSSDLSF